MDSHPENSPRVEPPSRRIAPGSAGTGVLSAIGSTPLVELTRLGSGVDQHIFGKLEMLNPGGSAKDRPALRMLLDGLASGAVREGGTVVESSSGNMGVALAQACLRLGLSLVCVVDNRISRQNLALLRAYGARIEAVDAPHPVTGDLLDARLARVQSLLGELPGAWWPNQYQNASNARAHAEGTAVELLDVLGHAPDFAFCATSTCGLLAGLVATLSPLGTRVVAVDAFGSALFGGGRCVRNIPGLGSSRRPELLAAPPADVVHVGDLDCVAGCHRLLSEEAILAGGSAGGVVTAALRFRGQMPRGASVVLVLMDRGERYLDTIYNPDWVASTLGSQDPVGEVYRAD